MKAVHANGNIREIFDNQLELILKKAQSPNTQQSIAIAYSGGLDSSVLLALATKFCLQNKIPLYAFHVNHGISINASKWESHCRKIASQNRAVFLSERVCIDKNGWGVEAAARELRYQALGKMCFLNSVTILLTGHHLNDQAETILMQLLRGTGLNGMAGMDQSNFAPSLLKHPTLLLARPLLPISREILSQYAIEESISYVDDESNAQIDYKRNAIRHLVMPVLEQVSPGFIHRLYRTAQHTKASIRILKELTRDDLVRCGNKDVLNIHQLNALSGDRIDQVLRHWISLHEVQMPSTAKLFEIKTQLLSSRDDAKVIVTHANIELYRYGNEIFIEYVKNKISINKKNITLTWQGEEKIYIQEFKGTLSFSRSQIGIDASWLRNQTLCIRERCGGERLRLAKNRPSRSIKSHFQTNRIPYWKRQQLPFIYAQDQLIYVASIGIDGEFLLDNANELIHIDWQPDSEIGIN